VLEFPHLEFEKLNEAEHLGYRSGTQYDIIYERLLRYPRASLGRKNPERDPPLRGQADYMLEINGRYWYDLKFGQFNYCFLNI